MADETNDPQSREQVSQEAALLQRQQLERVESELELLRLQQDVLGHMNSSLSERAALEQQILNMEFERDKLLRTASISQEEITQQYDAQKDALQKKLENLEKEGKLSESQEKSLKRRIEMADEMSRFSKDDLDNLEEQRRATIAINRIRGDLASQLDQRTPRAVKVLRDAMTIGGGKSPLKDLKTLAGPTALLGVVKALELAAKAVEFVVDAVTGVRRELVEINRVTLGNKEISEVYKNIATDTSQAASMAYKFGVTTKEVGKTLTEMYKENSAIQGLIESAGTEAASQLSIVATKYKDFGISASQAAQVVDIATRSMGMGASQTTELMKGLVEEASLAAQSPDKFVSSFVTQYPKLRIYGDRSKEIFTKINKEASDIGVSFDAITGIGRSFESYESAAMASTQLNMLLGSNFDALQAMAATPEELTGMLRQNISENDLRQMSHFQRRYLANILNVEYDQLERIVSGKEAKDREQQRFDMLAESATHDSQRVESLLENLKTGIGSAVNSLGMIEFLMESVAKGLDYLPGFEFQEMKEKSTQERKSRSLQELAAGSIRSISDLGIEGIDENELNFLRATASSQVKTAEKMLERMNITKEDNTKIIEILNDVRDGNSTTKEMVAVLGKLVTMFEDGSAKTISSLE